MSLESLESTTLKSAVKRLRILPIGTVSIHRRGVRKMVKLSLSKSCLEARIDPQNIQKYRQVPSSAEQIEKATYMPR